MAGSANFGDTTKPNQSPAAGGFDSERRSSGVSARWLLMQSIKKPSQAIQSLRRRWNTRPILRTGYFGVNPKFCVNAKLWCKIEQKYFKAGAAQAAAAFSTKITALRGDVKGGGVSLRSSRLLTFRLQPVSPACGRQRTPPTVRELRSSPAAFRSTSS